MPDEIKSSTWSGPGFDVFMIRLRHSTLRLSVSGEPFPLERRLFLDLASRAAGMKGPEIQRTEIDHIISRDIWFIHRNFGDSRGSAKEDRADLNLEN